jgi:DNA-binding CsgD family transcriptional regulator
VIALIAIILVVFNLLFIYLEPSKVENNWRIFIKDAIFLIIMIYCILIIERYYRKLDDNDEKKFFSKIVLLLLLLLPAIISDTFFLEHIRFKFFPIVYVMIGFMFFNYYIKIIRESPQNPGSENIYINNKKFPREKLTTQYSLTPREIEVVELLTEGKAYLSIAEELFISVNTVKSHSRKAYQKLNVGNRMELANLISRLTSLNVKELK